MYDRKEIYHLPEHIYRDKVYACWLGKNCGGTLGAPLEKGFGEAEPFDIHWYPELHEGGIPNDDLELQLIWLHLLETRGFNLTAQDFAQAWLDYVAYNPDEYGLHKTNLRLGLHPPVSGYYNNWFRDCMGSPIRSELWACLAPGAPELAVAFAYQDAIVDHAGGEGVWGALFNTALQSAAFVESDPAYLLDIALSYIPAQCACASTVQAARQAHAAGIPWQEARKQVISAAPHYNAQYAPINLGFQIIGWLYAQEFGEQLCLAVNCGYDTDCTAATLGALLGIIHGNAGLSQRWVAPLGNRIATSVESGGLRNLSGLLPATLEDLTERVCRLGKQLLLLRQSPVQIDTQQSDTQQNNTSSTVLRANPAQVKAYQQIDPLTLEHSLQTLFVTVTYTTGPAIAPGDDLSLLISLRNRQEETLVCDLSFEAPQGWQIVTSQDPCVTLAAYSSVQVQATVTLSDRDCLYNHNSIFFHVQPRQRPAEPIIPITLIGAHAWEIIGPLQDQQLSLAQLDHTHDYHAQNCYYAYENDVPTPHGTHWTGTLYARQWLWSPHEQVVRIGIPASCPRTLLVNGIPVHSVDHVTFVRPNYHGDGFSYIDTPVQQGWNNLLIIYKREATMPPFSAFLTLATNTWHDGITDMLWTRQLGDHLDLAASPLSESSAISRHILL